MLGHRRRKRGRRWGESASIYVDIYHSSDVILLAAIFILNLADAVLTLGILESGVVEKNPLAAGLIERGTGWFLAEKFFVVGLCLLALVIHKTFRLARMGAYGLLILYGFLTLHHISLRM